MTISLEERTTTVSINGRTLAAEVRKYNPGVDLVAWIPDIGESLTFEDTRDASIAGRFYNADKDATIIFKWNANKKADTFQKITVDRRTKTV